MQDQKAAIHLAEEIHLVVNQLEVKEEEQEQQQVDIGVDQVEPRVAITQTSKYDAYAV